MLFTLLWKILGLLVVVWLADHLWSIAWNYQLYRKMKAQGVVFLSGKYTLFGDALSLKKLRQKVKYF